MTNTCRWAARPRARATPRRCKRLKPGIEVRHRAPGRRGAETTRRRGARELSRRGDHRLRAEHLFTRSRRWSARSIWPRRCFAAGVPCFGSCWGLQVGVTAAGGSVVRNPRGREFGFGGASRSRARAVITPCSSASPRCSKPATVHVDTVESSAAGADAAGAQRHGLAGGRDQTQEGHVLGRAVPPGIQLRRDRGDGAALRRRADPRRSRARTRPSSMRWRRTSWRSHEHPDDARLAWRFGVGPSITDPGIKLAELRNWLDDAGACVMRRAGRSLAAVSRTVARRFACRPSLARTGSCAA